MSESDFYITLSNDSGDAYYPSNTFAHFTTHLPRNITLQGEWRVGLAEIHFPNSFIHLDYGEALIHFMLHSKDTGVKSIPCAIPHGIYSDVDSLIRCINRNTTLSKHFQFTYDKLTNYVMIKRTCKFEQCTK